MDGDRSEFERKKREAARCMRAGRVPVKRAREVRLDADRHSYSHQWTCLGLPVIQIPQNIVAVRELIWETGPAVILETGIASGGSLMFFASLLQMIGEGIVIGVDVDIRKENLAGILVHPLRNLRRVRPASGK